MKKILAECISLGLVLASCNLPYPKISTSRIPQSSNLIAIAWDDRSIFKSGLVASEQHVLGELSGASIYHLTLNIAADLYHVIGTEEVRYTNSETLPLNEVQFRLFPNILGGEMLITNLQVDGKPITPEYGLADSLMIVRLPNELGPAQSIVLKMDFSVTVPRSVEWNSGVLAYFEDVLTLAHAYPMICVFDDEGWNAEIPSQDGDVTYADASFYVVQVTAPKGLTLVTSGRKINSDEAGPVQTMVVASGPARDFFLAASPNFEEIAQKFGEVTIHSYARNNLNSGAQFALEVASKALGVYGKRYAPYPYSDLKIVSTPTLALGVEYPGAIAITNRIYHVQGKYRGSRASIYMESTVAHEVGHQWFYNLVGDDQLDDPWLDESLTQFATLQYYIDEYGAEAADGFRKSLYGRWAGVENAKIPIGLPVASYSPGEYDPIVYGRGPLFFETLKDKMGAPTFDGFIADYAKTLSWDIATPEFMQTLAEKHCACNLDPIFDEWVYPR